MGRERSRLHIPCCTVCYLPEIAKYCAGYHVEVMFSDGKRMETHIVWISRANPQADLRECFTFPCADRDGILICWQTQPVKYFQVMRTLGKSWKLSRENCYTASKPPSKLAPVSPDLLGRPQIVESLKLEIENPIRHNPID